MTFLALKGFILKVQSETIKVSIKAKKSMINYGYINHQAKFIATRPILQTSLNLVIFGKNDADFKEKKMFQRLLNPSLLMEVCIY